MEGKRVSVEEVKQAMVADFDRLAEAVAQALNAAQDGRIIADPEEPVRQANAVGRLNHRVRKARIISPRLPCPAATSRILLQWPL